jgi:hypothetical protein
LTFQRFRTGIGDKEILTQQNDTHQVDRPTGIAPEGPWTRIDRLRNRTCKQADQEEKNLDHCSSVLLGFGERGDVDEVFGEFGCSKCDRERYYVGRNCIFAHVQKGAVTPLRGRRFAVVRFPLGPAGVRPFAIGSCRMQRRRNQGGVRSSLMNRRSTRTYEVRLRHQTYCSA